MKSTLIVTLTMLSMAAPAFAQGDAEAGAREYNKCRSCHMIQDTDGNMIVQGGKTGPNLFNIVGSKFAAEEGFKYGNGLPAVAETHPDAVWDVASLSEYLVNPTDYVRAHSGNATARSLMTFRMPKGAAQDNLIAYLVSVSPDAPEQPTDSDGAPLAPPAAE
ncbi:cytochrome c family protein [Paracoccus sp. (in: a-proteobacteria)]|uniref:c-type cytochrome n=1 Tax=Paracoccus sp. TaxID=267 RepID=UPI0026DECA07|nr:cytochrome C [Paracoccus sp. (in: a-proteobacteria)]MDO5646912.1 cytochrome C [Paracoccus sp. (in: a-proteobacteria)]